MTRVSLLGTVIILTTLCTAACVFTPVTDQLKTASAGHTGCTPEQLTIANVRTSGGGLLWNATCNGKTYLCDRASLTSEESSCAPAQ
jgi:hypothetical protein